MVSIIFVHALLSKKGFNGLPLSERISFYSFYSFTGTLRGRSRKCFFGKVNYQVLLGKVNCCKMCLSNCCCNFNAILFSREIERQEETALMRNLSCEKYK